MKRGGVVRQRVADHHWRREPGHTHGIFILVLLLSVNVFNFVDRQLPYILVDAIRAELHLTDTQIGLMAGVPFAVVYAVGALVVARVADRVSAPLVLSVCLLVWSLATAASGLAHSFRFLILARSGVAAGESGSNPSAHAIIARLFPLRRRTTVFAIFSLGLPIGSAIGLMLGGWINDAMGWRSAFLLVGLPGVALAALVWTGVRRPGARPDVAPPSTTSFAQAVAYLLRLPSFRHMLVGAALFGVVFYAVSVFTPAFLMRIHHLSATKAGLALGVLSGVGAIAGTLTGGALADVLGARNARWHQLVPAFGVTLCVPAALGAWLVDDVHVALASMAVLYFASMINAAPTWANIQLLAPDDMRATATALVQFSASLIGATVGPLLVGWTSDRLAPHFGVQSLRYALCIVVVFMAWSGWHYRLAAGAMARDLARHGDGPADPSAATS